MNEVLQVIEALASEGITMVIVTHEMNFAFKVSDRIVFMEKGRVVCDDAPRRAARWPASARGSISEGCLAGVTMHSTRGHDHD
ncbi:hypothetical protein WDV93_02310 [Pantoea ananatis]